MEYLYHICISNVAFCFLGRKETYSTDKLLVTILLNAFRHDLVQTLVSFFGGASKHYRHLVYAGQALKGNGSWILSDDIFTFADFAQVLRNEERVLASSHPDEVLAVNAFAEGDWTEAHLNKAAPSFNVRFNLFDAPEFESAQMDITEFIKSFSQNMIVGSDCLQPSSVSGSLTFARPTAYIFPGGGGDSVMFGIKTFNMLIDGGARRRSVFWDFVKNLQNIDALLLTHVGGDNFRGIESFLEANCVDPHPKVGVMFMNLTSADQKKSIGGSTSPATLLVSLPDEASRIVHHANSTDIILHPIVGHARDPLSHPVSLFHNIGYGRLDMFILNPVEDSKEMKEFEKQLSLQGSSFGSAVGGIPLNDAVSACVLLVWKPVCETDDIIRILLPGSTPPTRIYEALDKLKGVAMFDHLCCTEKTLKTISKVQPTSKPVASASKPVSVASASKPVPVAKANVSRSNPASSSKVADTRNSSKVQSPPKLAAKEAPVSRTKPVPSSAQEKSKPTTATLEHLPQKSKATTISSEHSPQKAKKTAATSSDHSPQKSRSAPPDKPITKKTAPPSSDSIKTKPSSALSAISSSDTTEKTNDHKRSDLKEINYSANVSDSVPKIESLQDDKTGNVKDNRFSDEVQDTKPVLAQSNGIENAEKMDLTPEIVEKIDDVRNAETFPHIIGDFTSEEKQPETEEHVDDLISPSEIIDLASSNSSVPVKF